MLFLAVESSLCEAQGRGGRGGGRERMRQEPAERERIKERGERVERERRQERDAYAKWYHQQYYRVHDVGEAKRALEAEMKIWSQHPESRTKLERMAEEFKLRVEDGALVQERFVEISDVSSPRLKYEEALPTAKDAGLSKVDRAHAFGRILGAESPFGIRYARSEYNKQTERLVEEGIRDLVQRGVEHGEGYALRVTVRTTSAAHDPRALGKRVYEISLLKADMKNPRMLEYHVPGADALGRRIRNDRGEYDVKYEDGALIIEARHP